MSYLGTAVLHYLSYLETSCTEPAVAEITHGSKHALMLYNIKELIKTFIEKANSITTWSKVVLSWKRTLLYFSI